MLSADISGFTALSERHSAQGRAGSEALLTTISSCFTDLIDAATGQGGDVVKFGGDALLIIFRGDDHPVRCALTGVAMQRALQQSRVARQAGLTMTVGAGSGPFDVVLAGNDRRELLVLGDAADEVLRLESDAAAGETLVDATIAAALPSFAVTGEHDGGFVLEPDLPIAAVTSAHGAPSATDLTALVPAPVVEQLDAFAELGGEHRFATVGFLEVRGVGERLRHDPLRTVGQIGDVIEEVASIGR